MMTLYNIGYESSYIVLVVMLILWCVSGCGANVTEPRKNGPQGAENQHWDSQVKIEE